MKSKIFFITLLISGLALAQNTIKVEIENIKNNRGTIALAIYDNAKDFTKKEMKAKKVKAKKGKTFAYFNNIPKGNYAIAIFHDENNNDKMDFNLMGIPKEPYGFSNNAKGFMSAPKFEKASFSLGNNETKLIKIKL